MKKIVLTMMACAALYACADDEITVKSGEESGAQLDGDVAYITVNLNKVNSSYSRAESAGFAYGSDNENAVKSVNFYFYDANGDYVTNGNVSNSTWTANEDDPATNIEAMSDIVVAVWGLSGDFPSYMVTIINEPDGFIHGTTLEEIYEKLSNTTNGKNGDYFVMSTSTYLSNGNIVYYTTLTDDNFAMEPVTIDTDYPDGKNVVDVYVERLSSKVTVSLAEELSAGENTISDDIVVATDILDDVTLQGLGEDVLAIKFLGFGLDATSRDSYMIKNISTDWSTFSFVFNDVGDYRSYWAMSPNYDDATTEYPTSSNANTDSDEEDSSTWLNEYLRYSSLASVTEFGEDAYCAENTNTAEILTDNISAKTHALVKAQLGTYDAGTFTPVDMLRYHGEYFEEEKFMHDMVERVMEYDFETISKEVIDYLEEHYSFLESYIEEIANNLEHVVYYAKSDSDISSAEAFNEKFLKLINKGDGYVNIWLCSTPSQLTDGTSFGDYDYHDYYYSLNLLSDSLDLDDYKLYFKIDGEELSAGLQSALNILGLESLIVRSGSDYYLAMDSSLITLTTEAGHKYDLRNYLIRALEKELASINEDAGDVNYYKDGMMYYAVPIEHIATSTDETIVEGQYGVVRNAWYNLTVYDVAGIGHGIAVEDEVIVPIEEPDYYYLGAYVNILSWDKIDQSVTLQ